MLVSSTLRADQCACATVTHVSRAVCVGACNVWGLVMQTDNFLISLLPEQPQARAIDVARPSSCPANGTSHHEVCTNTADRCNLENKQLKCLASSSTLHAPGVPQLQLRPTCNSNTDLCCSRARQATADAAALACIEMHTKPLVQGCLLYGKPSPDTCMHACKSTHGSSSARGVTRANMALPSHPKHPQICPTSMPTAQVFCATAHTLHIGAAAGGESHTLALHAGLQIHMPQRASVLLLLLSLKMPWFCSTQGPRSLSMDLLHQQQ